MHTLYENYMLTAQLYAACIFIESCEECTAQSDRILLDNNAGDSAYPPKIKDVGLIIQLLVA